MINPDAKCVVNGSKVNDVIIALNPLLNMDIIVGDVNEPEIKHGQDGWQIVVPSPDSYTNEELDVVDSSNTASSRWFLTSTSQGSASSAGASTTTANATPVNKSMPVAPNKGRDKLPREGGGQDNREKLNTVAGGGEGVKVGAGRPIEPRGKGAFGGGTDAFGNELYADGTRVTPGGRSGDLADDGLTAAQAGAQFRAKKGAPPLTGAPPLPGAPPLTGDDVADDTKTPQTTEEATARKSHLSNLMTKMARARKRLREAEANDTMKWNNEKQRWDYKKPGDPDSAKVAALRKEHKRLKAEYRKATAQA